MVESRSDIGDIRPIRGAKSVSQGESSDGAMLVDRRGAVDGRGNCVCGCKHILHVISANARTASFYALISILYTVTMLR